MNKNRVFVVCASRTETETFAASVVCGDPTLVRKTHPTRLLSLFLLFAAIVTLSSCTPRGDGAAAQTEISVQETQAVENEAPSEDKAANQNRSVRVLGATVGVLTSNRSASVAVEPGAQSQVAAQTSGQITEVLVREGGVVTKGQTVIQLNTEDLLLQQRNAVAALQTARINLTTSERSSGDTSRQAETALQTAESALRLAEKQYNEGQQLVAANGLAQTELTQLETQVKQATLNYQQAQDALAKAQRAPSEDLEVLRLQIEQAQAQLAQIETSLRNASIQAPFDGEVATILVNVGEYISAGSPAFKLVSTSQQLAKFSVPPEDVTTLLGQQTVYVPYGGLDYAAYILRSEPVPGQSRLVQITAEFYPSETRIPTGSVSQLRYSRQIAEGILVPSPAVQARGSETNVFVIEDGVAKLTPVRVIAEEGGKSVLEGIGVGATLVYPIPADLLDGAAVSVLEVKK